MKDFKVRGKAVSDWRENAEEDYASVPISVLKYITILEEMIWGEEPPEPIVNDLTPTTHD